MRRKKSGGAVCGDQLVADQSAEASRPGNNEGVKSMADII